MIARQLTIWPVAVLAAGVWLSAPAMAEPVPTPKDVLDAAGLTQLAVPGIVTVLKEQKPDLVLLMCGSNGFNAPETQRLIESILGVLSGQLLVATIPPQRPPREGWQQVNAYNAALTAIVAEQVRKGGKLRLVDMHTAVSPENLLEDGVHPNRQGMEKMAEVWLKAIMETLASLSSGK